MIFEQPLPFGGMERLRKKIIFVIIFVAFLQLKKRGIFLVLCVPLFFFIFINDGVGVGNVLLLFFYYS